MSWPEILFLIFETEISSVKRQLSEVLLLRGHTLVTSSTQSIVFHTISSHPLDLSWIANFSQFLDVTQSFASFTSALTSLHIPLHSVCRWLEKTRGKSEISEHLCGWVYVCVRLLLLMREHGKSPNTFATIVFNAYCASLLWFFVRELFVRVVASMTKACIAVEMWRLAFSTVFFPSLFCCVAVCWCVWNEKLFNFSWRNFFMASESSSISENWICCATTEFVFERIFLWFLSLLFEPHIVQFRRRRRQRDEYRKCKRRIQMRKLMGNVIRRKDGKRSTTEKKDSMSWSTISLCLH